MDNNEEKAASEHSKPDEQGRSNASNEGEKKKHPMIIYMIAICATVGGLLFGYDTGIINGALLIIEEDFEMNSFWKESIVTATVFAAAVFSLTAGILADFIGRKKAIMGAAVVFTIGAFVMGIAPNLTIIFIGRFIVGAAIGLVSCIVPVYVSECAPKEIRGFLITLNQLFITIGILLSSILAGMLQNVPHGWRFMLGLAAIPGIIQLIFFIKLPESPRYLVMKGELIKASEILTRIRAPGDDIEQELREIKETVDAEAKNKGFQVFKAVITTRHVRKALIIGCLLQFFQQVSGINTVIYYSATILKGAGFSTDLAVWLSTIPFSINFLATFIGLWTVETLGRRNVLAISYLAIAVSCCVLSIGFIKVSWDSPDTLYLNDPGSVGQCAKYSTCEGCLTLSYHECGYCGLKDNIRQGGACVEVKKIDNVAYGTKGRCAKGGSNTTTFMNEFCPNDYAWIPLVGLVLFVLSFAPGAGPMPWTLNAEIYPIWARSVANSLATLSNWLSNVLVSFSFMTLVRTFQAHGTFFIFTTLCLMSAVFTLLFVPETKGKPLEEIEYLFMGPNDRREHKIKMMKNKQNGQKTTSN